MISLFVRRWHEVAAFALIFAGLASAALAQTPYPSRTITSSRRSAWTHFQARRNSSVPSWASNWYCGKS